MAELEKVIKDLEICIRVQDNEKCPDECPYRKDICYGTVGLMADALTLLKAQEPGWVPFIKRPLTEEEKKLHPEWCYILDGDVPENEQEILLYRHWKNKSGYIIEMDQYIDNGVECYLECAGDIENGMWWCALPEPPKEG